MADTSGDELIPKYPLLPKPRISYGMVHKLDCVQETSVSLPTIIDNSDGGIGIGVGDGESIGTAPESVAEPAPANSKELTGSGSEAAFVDSEVASTATKADEIKYAWNSPRLMILCEHGDINSAMHHLLKSLHDPFALDAVATLLIQECLLERFINRVIEGLHELDAQVATHPIFLRTLAKLEELKARTIVGDKEVVPPNTSPILVCDFTHHYLGEGPTGVITMHTFRTPKEATQVYLKETVQYCSVSIWNEKLASAYEIVALVNADTFLVNCFNVDLDPIKPAFEGNRNDVRIVKGYHYETLTIKQKRKIIVFPVGTIFAN